MEIQALKKLFKEKLHGNWKFFLECFANKFNIILQQSKWRLQNFSSKKGEI